MNKMNLIYALALTLAPSFANALELEVDPAHSSLGFDIKHLVVSTVHGNFTDFSGNLTLDEKDFTQSKINFSVKVDSINTTNAKRDGHLKSPDFFDASKYPSATFTSTSIKKDGKDKYTLLGDLTLHGVTQKNTKFTLINLGKVKDPYGVEKYMYQATTQLKRKDFGLVYNAKLESGGVVIGEEVKLTIDIEAAQKAPAPQATAPAAKKS